MRVLVGKLVGLKQLALSALFALSCVFASPMMAYATTSEGSVAYENAPVIFVGIAIVAFAVALIYEALHRRKERRKEEEKRSSNKDN
ncbi:hypothetical protein D7W09_00650 [bacterium D16-34]|nr:hypothetical protein D7W09_00650 [bacterium D16-34]